MAAAASVIGKPTLANLTPAQIADLIERHMPVLRPRMDARSGTYVVPSKRSRSIQYAVSAVLHEDGTVTRSCSCEAAAHRTRCSHLILVEREIARHGVDPNERPRDLAAFNARYAHCFRTAVAS